MERVKQQCRVGIAHQYRYEYRHLLALDSYQSQGRGSIAAVIYVVGRVDPLKSRHRLSAAILETPSW